MKIEKPEGRSRKVALVRSAEDLLERALRDAEQRLSALSEDPAERTATASRLDELASTLKVAIDSGRPVDRETAADSSFGTFVDVAIDELIRSGTEQPSDAVATLEAIRLLTLARRPRLDLSQEADDLRLRLRAPDAFELLVEVAHDFRSPLTSILFLSETLRTGNSGPVNETQRSQLGLMYSAAFGLASVASDVMDLARQGKDVIEDEPQPYLVEEVFESVRRLVSPIVEEKGLELGIVSPPRLRAHGHPHALARVLLNLTTNALKFTDEGGVEIGVDQLAWSRLEFWVQDTGRGIPEDRRRELYKPFKRRRGDQDGHFFSGSGVGLSIARRLVRAMGSDLAYQTSDESGTRFSFVVSSVPPARP